MVLSQETLAHSSKTKLFVGVFLMLAFGILLYAVNRSTDMQSKAANDCQKCKPIYEIVRGKRRKVGEECVNICKSINVQLKEKAIPKTNTIQKPIENTKTNDSPTPTSSKPTGTPKPTSVKQL